MKSYPTPSHNPNSGVSDERRARELKAYAIARQRKAAAVNELRRLGQIRRHLFDERAGGWLSFADYQRRDAKVADRMDRIRRQFGIR